MVYVACMRMNDHVETAELSQNRDGRVNPPYTLLTTASLHR